MPNASKPKASGAGEGVRKVGRPSVRSEALADTIVTRLAEGESLRAICFDAGMPNLSTVLRWQADDADFASRCAHAREAQAEVMDERIMSAANRVECGDLDPQAGRVAISAYQWRASKLAPKRYGERIAHDHQGALAVAAIEMTTDQAARVAHTILAGIAPAEGAGGAPDEAQGAS